MALTLESLQVLDAIERNGSFAAAANELHRVPSAVTYTVQRLEDDLGVALFDRRGRRATLTAAGEVVLAKGRPLLEAANDLEATVRRVATGWETELRIAVDGLFPVSALYPIVERFHAQQPDIDVRLSREVLAGAWDALLEDRADLVVGATGEGPPGGGYTVQPMGELSFHFVAAPSHPLADREHPLTPAEVRGHRAVAVADTARTRPVRTTGLHGGQPVLTVPDQETKLTALLRGLGVGHLPWHAAAPHFRNGTLRRLTLAEPMPPVTTYLAWRTPRRGRALGWFVEALTDGEGLASFLG